MTRFRRLVLHQLEAIDSKLADVLASLATIVRKEVIIMATLDDLLSDVQDETTVVGSVVTLLNNLSAQLAAAIAANDPAKIQAVKDAIDANKASLAAAVAANTPGAPTP